MGFVIEQMVEENDQSVTDNGTVKDKQAKMIPLLVCFKARKLSYEIHTAAKSSRPNKGAAS